MEETLMTTWEYYVVTISEKDIDYDTNKTHVMESESIESRLNYCGGQGWELVAFVPAIPGTNTQEAIHRSWGFHAVFKRPQAES